MSANVDNSATAQGAYMAIYRGATNVFSGRLIYTSSGFVVINQNITYLDSPATTSSTTYTMYFKTTAGTVYFQPDGSDDSPATITLLEIAQ